MTVSVLAGEGIVILRQSVVVLMIDEAFSQIPVALVAASLISKEEIFRQRVGFIPSIGDGLMRPGFLLGLELSPANVAERRPWLA